MPDGGARATVGLTRAGISAHLRDVVVARGGRRILDGLSIGFPPDGVTVLMGPNGGGKSLALRVMAGLITPDSGQVSIDGAERRVGGIAIVFQKPVLLRRSVSANLWHAVRAHRVPRADRSGRIDELLTLGGLTALAGSPARSLSGGEQQCLAMVRALAAKPSLLLLDEPTASLDPSSTAQIETLVRRTSAEGVKVVLVTHDLNQARRLADDVVFLNRGRAVEQSSAESFFASPQSAEARAYLTGELLF